jgi:hypothetical protein
MTWTSSALVLERGTLGDFSITRSSILRRTAFARQLTPQWCAFETISRLLREGVNAGFPPDTQTLPLFLLLCRRRGYSTLRRSFFRWEECFSFHQSRFEPGSNDPSQGWECAEFREKCLMVDVIERSHN